MSGGFFRGTSADQDTRFSNKQAKLLKSQKFAPELENLVDTTKVKMDVMRPWIAKRVHDLIGFDDEVLINFIFGLLEGKAVNGKEVQISLTGFMERNTGKFMKELWALLLSAQQNVSGIPQQFLDAKEEEAKHKKAETDRIANEIHRNKEKERLEFEQQSTKMGGEDSMSRDKHTGSGFDVKHDARESSLSPANDKERITRNGRRGRHRSSRSPDSDYHSRSPRRRHSASPSNSNSYSNERGRSRSASGAPLSRSRSVSSERKRHVSRDRSVTPIRRRNVRRSPSPRHSKRRSTSRSRYRSPSPVRRRIRSPVRHRSRSSIRRRSRSPMHRRSRSPIRRRSPVRSHGRRRSRTPMRRSPMRYRSRSPLRRRSPSPARRRSPSPARRRSPSPARRRSPSPARRRTPSPARRRSPSPARRRSPSPARRRSPSPTRRRLPSPVRHRSPSPVHRSRSTDRRKSPLSVGRKSQSPASDGSLSPVHRRIASPKRRSSPYSRHQSSPSRRRYQRSPSTPRQRSVSPARGGSSGHARKRSFSPLRQGSPIRKVSSSPVHVRRGSLSPIERGSLKGMRSPIPSPRGRARRHDHHSPAHSDSPDERAERPVENRKGVRLRSPQRDTLDRDNLHGKDRNLSSSLQKSPITTHISRSGSESNEQRLDGPRGRPEVYAHRTKSKNTQMPNSDKVPDGMDHKEPDVRQELSVTPKKIASSLKGREGHNDDDDSRVKAKKISHADDGKGSNRLSQRETLPKLSGNSEQNDQNGSWDSPSKDATEGRVKPKEKRKHRKSDSQESDDYSSDDSYEGRKEAKRRRKEEKKLKKEKRRRRREERRRRKEERRSEKQKFKSGDSDSSSSEDQGRHHPENESVKMQDSRASDIQEAELDQKKLEIELREKALETLRAKKGLGN